MINLDELIDLDDDPQVSDPVVDDPSNIPATDDPVDEPNPDPTPVDAGDDDPEPDPEVDEAAKAYYEYLVENDVIHVPDDFVFDGTVDGIQKALDATKEYQRNSVKEELWNGLADDFKPLLEYGLMGGSSLEEYLATYGPSDIENVDISDPISQKAVINYYYKTVNPNYSDERIDKMVARLEEMGSLEEEAQDAVDYLAEMRDEQKRTFLEKEKQRQAEEAAAAAQYAETIQSAVDTSNYDDMLKGRIKSMLFNPNTQQQEFERKLNAVWNNPSHFIQLVALLADYNEQSGFTYDRIKKQLKSESNRNFQTLVVDKLNNKKQISSSGLPLHDDFDFSKFTGQ